MVHWSFSKVEEHMDMSGMSANKSWHIETRIYQDYEAKHILQWDTKTNAWKRTCQVTVFLSGKSTEMEIAGLTLLLWLSVMCNLMSKEKLHLETSSVHTWLGIWGGLPVLFHSMTARIPICPEEKQRIWDDEY